MLLGVFFDVKNPMKVGVDLLSIEMKLVLFRAWQRGINSSVGQTSLGTKYQGFGLGWGSFACGTPLVTWWRDFAARFVLCKAADWGSWRGTKPMEGSGVVVLETTWQHREFISGVKPWSREGVVNECLGVQAAFDNGMRVTVVVTRYGCWWGIFFGGCEMRCGKVLFSACFSCRCRLDWSGNVANPTVESGMQ